MRRHDSKEFALIQLEQAIVTLISIGDQSTVEGLARMHERAIGDLEDGGHVAQAVEHLMAAVGDNGSSCFKCGDTLTGHEDDSGDRCRWCNTYVSSSVDAVVDA